MLLQIDNQKCSGCSACANICPKNCITMEQDTEGFLYPKIDKTKCVSCCICEKFCPAINRINIVNKQKEAYACFTKDEETRLNSSSGGLFTEIASWIIQNNGVVFGASFTKDFYTVEHIEVDNLSALEKLRGSKYLQSDIGDTYKKAKNYLEQGRYVLFSGTPCQIVGLKSYLGKDYDNLFTQDIICHGVPSQLVWKKYLLYLEKKYKSKTKSVSFRNKRYGWENYCISIELEKGRYIKRNVDDNYMKAFLSDLDLRPSCYDCHYKTKDRISDFTLADFWGVKNILPEMNDDKGTSLIVLHTKKAKDLFSIISDNLYLRKVDFESAIKYNSAMTRSCALPKNRDEFMVDVKNQEFNLVCKKYIKLNKKSLKSIVKRILNKFRRKH